MRGVTIAIEDGQHSGTEVVSEMMTETETGSGPDTIGITEIGTEIKGAVLGRDVITEILIGIEMVSVEWKSPAWTANVGSSFFKN